MWQRRRILICGKTRPELSKTHKETVCTGGVFEDTKQFVRLYPIPLRFLDDTQVFKKYQWITADVQKSSTDYRPESYNIRCDTIEVGDAIPTAKGDWSRRAEWITEPPGHVFPSVEALLVAWRTNGTSIGMVKPAEVLDWDAKAYPEKYRRGYWNDYRQIVAQQEFQFEPELDIGLLPPPEYRFRITFRCGDEACTKPHRFTVFDWEVDALYNRLRRSGASTDEACEKVLVTLQNACDEDKDTHFLLGNIFAHPQKFTIGGLWYPKRQPAGLFDGL